MPEHDDDDRPGSPWAKHAPAKPSESRPLATEVQTEKGRSHPFRRRLLAITAVLALIAVGVAYLVPPSTWRLDGGEQLVSLGVIGLLLVLGMAAGRTRLSILGKQALAWTAVVAILLVGYSYRGILSEIPERIGGTLAPSRGIAVDANTVTYTRARDGHFWIDAKADGSSVRFMVDTGASTVVLAREDAKRLGFDVSKLTYSRLFSTANGTTRGAPVKIRELTFGPLVFHDVTAFVTEGQLDSSLMGMGLLEQFRGIEIARDTLTIRR